MSEAKCLNVLSFVLSQVYARVPETLVNITVHGVSFALGTCAGGSRCVALSFRVCMVVASVCVCVVLP